jgi:hypothetical protein
MRSPVAAICSTAIVALILVADCPAEDLPPIQNVEIGSQRAFLVNGQPFFPVMAWLQDAKNFSAVKACGMNTTAGYYPGSSGTDHVGQYMKLVADAGLYGVLSYDARLKDHPQLLGYIHGDEPDLPHSVNDAEVIPGEELRINRKTPLWKIFDGVTHSWSVVDPLEGGQFTLRLPQPVTVQRLAVWLTVSNGLAVAKQITFRGDGRELLTADLKAERGAQEFDLDEPTTFRELTVAVGTTFPGEQVWGSISEIQGFDARGNNVLLSPPRNEPRAWPDAVQAEYRKIKSADPSRPVFMTLTGNFHPHFNKWTAAQRSELYPAYIQAADVVGYDIYPIYGWNKPEWLHLVHDATGLLVDQAGPRPVYAWIETSKGGQYTGPLERQHEVTPAHIKAEVWMAICRGATAIGYFTHIWKPAYRQFGVPEENRRALREINRQITGLAPAILAPPASRDVSIRAKDAVKVDCLAKQHEGELYLFAVNYDERAVPADATLTVDGLPADAEIEVIDEERQIRAEAGAFQDAFAPLAVHIYRIKVR